MYLNYMGKKWDFGIWVCNMLIINELAVPKRWDSVGSKMGYNIYKYL